MENVFILIITMGAIAGIHFFLMKVRDEIKIEMHHLANENKEIMEKLVHETTINFICSRLQDGKDLLKEIVNFFHSGNRREALLFHELAGQLETWYRYEGFPYLGREERKRFEFLFKQYDSLKGISHLAMTTTSSAQTERYLEDAEDLYARLNTIISEDHEKLLGNYVIVDEEG